MGHKQAEANLGVVLVLGSWLLCSSTSKVYRVVWLVHSETSKVYGGMSHMSVHPYFPGPVSGSSIASCFWTSS